MRINCLALYVTQNLGHFPTSLLLAVKTTFFLHFSTLSISPETSIQPPVRTFPRRRRTALGSSALGVKRGAEKGVRSCPGEKCAMNGRTVGRTDWMDLGRPERHGRTRTDLRTGARIMESESLTRRRAYLSTRGRGFMAIRSQEGRIMAAGSKITPRLLDKSSSHGPRI